MSGLHKDAPKGDIKPALVAAWIHSLRQLRRFENMAFEVPAVIWRAPGRIAPRDR